MGQANKLTQLKIDKLKTKGWHGDGAGLWLNVTDTGSKSWVLRYMIAGRSRMMGLGAYPTVTLAEARDKAIEERRKIRQGIDPLDAKRHEVATLKAEKAKGITFAEAAEKYIDAHQAAWKNDKHISQWRNTITTYANPIIGTLNIGLVETGHIIKILEEIWKTKTETASRLRGRIENVLDWATVRGFRKGENPARWKGHLDKLLPAKGKVAKRDHFPALPWKDAATFMAALRDNGGVAAFAVEFAVLTATRSGEVRMATWGEFDLKEKVWTIPAERMKAKKEHRVPLNKQAIELLEKVKPLNPRGYVFPGTTKDENKNLKPLSDMSLTAVLRRMDEASTKASGNGWRDTNGEQITVHGFRSTFSDWAAECTNFPREVVEMALAHTIGNKVEAAYRRGDLFEKRIKLMEAWADFCDRPISNTNNVIGINAA